MGALEAERLKKSRAGARTNLPVKATAQIYRGGLVALLAGVALAAGPAASRAEANELVVIGLAADSALGGASDGDVRVEVEKGVFQLANSAGADEIGVEHIGRYVYAADDQTVALTNGGGMRPIAGTVEDVDEGGVWVKLGGEPPRRVILPFAIGQTDLLAGTAAELVAPEAGAVTLLQTTVQTAVTTGGAITVEVNGVAVDGLSVAVANGAAKGARGSDTPTAGHATTVVAAGDRITVTPAAAFDTAGAVSGFVEITL